MGLTEPHNESSQPHLPEAETSPELSADDYRSVRESAARHRGVDPEIHPDDFIFQFLFENTAFASKDKAIEYYFNDGANSASTLHKMLTEICGLEGKQIELLEFASGYGCVTRHLKNVLPMCASTSCDIHQEAVRFIQNRLESAAVLSTARPEDLSLQRQFDVIFVLSFFSHMPKRSFPRWLKTLASFVKPGGFLIFTTHGRVSRKFFPSCQFDEDGFYFTPASEQKDLGTEEYGTTVVEPGYVFDRIVDTPGLTLKYFHEGFWWQHQDIYIASRGLVADDFYITDGRLMNAQSGFLKHDQKRLIGAFDTLECSTPELLHIKGWLGDRTTQKPPYAYLVVYQGEKQLLRPSHARHDLVEKNLDGQCGFDIYLRFTGESCDPEDFRMFVIFDEETYAEMKNVLGFQSHKTQVRQ